MKGRHLKEMHLLMGDLRGVTSAERSTKGRSKKYICGNGFCERRLALYLGKGSILQRKSKIMAFGAFIGTS